MGFTLTSVVAVLSDGPVDGVGVNGLVIMCGRSEVVFHCQTYQRLCDGSACGRESSDCAVERVDLRRDGGNVSLYLINSAPRIGGGEACNNEGSEDDERRGKAHVEVARVFEERIGAIKIKLG